MVLGYINSFTYIHKKSDSIEPLFETSK